jgi:hypothetical protein
LIVWFVLAATAADRDVLPSGRHTASLLDLWFLESVNLQPSGTAIGAFDRPYFSTHGRSWTTQAFLLNALDVSDPGRSGTPLLELPYPAWDSVHLYSLAPVPGIEWRTGAATGTRVQVGAASDVGGGTWIPPGVMDREPATDFGAPAARRTLLAPAEVFMEQGHSNMRVFVDYLHHLHRYPTLPATELARRATGGVEVHGPIPLRLYWQSTERSHAGAEYRHPLALTLAENSQAVVAQASGELAFATWALGLGFKDESRSGSGDGWLVDLEQEWAWMHRPIAAGTRRAARADVQLRAPWQAWAFALRAAGLYNRDHPSPVPQGSSYRGTPISLFLPAAGNPEAELRYTLALAAERAWDATRVDFGIDHADTPWPFAGVTWRDGPWSAAARYQPEPFTSQMAQFLSPTRANGVVHQWRDDGDLRPEASEAGLLLRRSGGAWHERAAWLRRPSALQAAVAWSGPVGMEIKAVGRLLFDRWTVREVHGTYAPVTVADPHGGLGKDGDTQVFYARTDQDWGSEIYRVDNATSPDAFVGAELQLLRIERPRWFARLAGKGYYSLGGAAFGLFADRNDSGVLVEQDDNGAVHARGRFDNDRAFGVKLQAGGEPFPGLHLGTVLRYRDGEPMTRIYVHEDLPQGPTAVMAMPRGAPWPRYTFHMTWDARVLYRPSDLPLSFWVDLFNILGSGTELLEDVASGPAYRTPLEMVPGRSIFLGLAADL